MRSKRDTDYFGVIIFALILIMLLFSISQNVVYFNLLEDIRKNYPKILVCIKSNKEN